MQLEANGEPSSSRSHCSCGGLWPLLLPRRIEIEMVVRLVWVAFVGLSAPLMLATTAAARMTSEKASRSSIRLRWP